MICVRAVSTWLPDTRETLAEALADGRMTEQDLERSGYSSIPVAGPDLPGPVLAANAARAALAESGVDPARVGLLLHAWTEYQGHDLWSPPHYIADQVGAGDALPVGVRQLSNGGAAATELAASWLHAHQDGLAVVTTGDRFCLPGFDRWRSDRGLVHADAGTAMVLAAAPGPADALRLLGIASASAPRLEGMHRGDDPFSTGRYDQGAPIDLARTKKAFFAAHTREAFTDTATGKAKRVVTEAAERAGVALDDLRHLLLPRIGRLTYELYRPVFGEITTAEVLDRGEHTGHLGAGDLLANLADLTTLLGPGEKAAVFNGGGGYTWTAVVVERPA
ncbi:putative 3-oxoacyl-ACP synthase III [Actinokineospora spheciospongiae]|uniref:Putative 3-oxoacyl-ACP synthase III n=1 Tax=Actinokineospora spheciospongiae TaxID=909613 RepID=W7IEG7_9PSEU|nr:3-oxoacyl-[acyl-carrier-protein] synthase III C-terminal domain-containing protein [Actinokineospora spheciospongiae]EWC59245.1 putative 3-oxoacyl-ACP synthase III [Actinokineospora spheciospongiae]